MFRARARNTWAEFQYTENQVASVRTFSVKQFIRYHSTHNHPDRDSHNQRRLNYKVPMYVNLRVHGKIKDGYRSDLAISGAVAARGDTSYAG